MDSDDEILCCMMDTMEGEEEGEGVEDWTDTGWAQPPTDLANLYHTRVHSTHRREDSNSAAICANIIEKTTERADPSVIQRMLLNDNKAGMEGLDKEKINQIIHEASKGSKFYENERLKDEQMKKRIEEQKRKIKTITEAQLQEGLQEADKLLEDFDQQRDLSRTIVHIDMDAFYAAVEMRDRPDLKDKPMAVGGTQMLSTSNYHARKFGVRAAMPGFIGKKLCPDLILVPLNFDKYTAVSKDVRSVFCQYDANFCPMSLDEAYLDITEHLEQRATMSDLERTFICRYREYVDSRNHCVCDLNEIARNHGNAILEGFNSIDVYSYLNEKEHSDIIALSDKPTAHVNDKFELSSSQTNGDILELTNIESKEISKEKSEVTNLTEEMDSTDKDLAKSLELENKVTSTLTSITNKDCIETTARESQSVEGCRTGASRRASCPVCQKEFPPFYHTKFGLSDEETVRELRTRIEQKTRLTASAGIAPNMMLAKVCSDKNKPNGQYKVPADKNAVIDFVRNLPLRKISGIGKVSEAMLNALDVHTCTDLYERRALLYHLYSQISFNYFMRICLGIGSTTVERDSDRKSMSTERTFSELSRPADLYRKCEELCECLAADLKEEHLKGKTVGLKIKTVKFEVKTKAQTVREYSNDKDVMLRAATELLRTEIQAVAPNPLRLRLMGVRMSNLLPESHCSSKKQNTILGVFKKLTEKQKEQNQFVKSVSAVSEFQLAKHMNNQADIETVNHGNSAANTTAKDVSENSKQFEDTRDVTPNKSNTQSHINLKSAKNSQCNGLANESTEAECEKSNNEKDLYVNCEEIVNSISEKTDNISAVSKSLQGVDERLRSDGSETKHNVTNLNSDDNKMCLKPAGCTHTEKHAETMDSALGTPVPVILQPEHTLEHCNESHDLEIVTTPIPTINSSGPSNINVNSSEHAPTAGTSSRKTRSGLVITPNRKQGRSRRNSKRGKLVAYTCPVCAKEILCANLNEFNEHVDDCLEGKTETDVADSATSVSALSSRRVDEDTTTNEHVIKTITADSATSVSALSSRRVDGETTTNEHVIKSKTADSATSVSALSSRRVDGDTTTNDHIINTTCKTADSATSVSALSSRRVDGDTTTKENVVKTITAESATSVSVLSSRRVDGDTTTNEHVIKTISADSETSVSVIQSRQGDTSVGKSVIESGVLAISSLAPLSSQGSAETKANESVIETEIEVSQTSAPDLLSGQSVNCTFVDKTEVENVIVGASEISDVFETQVDTMQMDIDTVIGIASELNQENRIQKSDNKTGCDMDGIVKHNIDFESTVDIKEYSKNSENILKINNNSVECKKVVSAYEIHRHLEPSCAQSSNCDKTFVTEGGCTDIVPESTGKSQPVYGDNGRMDEASVITSAENKRSNSIENEVKLVHHVNYSDKNVNQSCTHTGVVVQQSEETINKPFDDDKLLEPGETGLVRDGVTDCTGDDNNNQKQACDIQTDQTNHKIQEPNVISVYSSFTISDSRTSAARDCETTVNSVDDGSERAHLSESVKTDSSKSRITAVRDSETTINSVKDGFKGAHLSESVKTDSSNSFSKTIYVMDDAQPGSSKDFLNLSIPDPFDMVNCEDSEHSQNISKTDDLTADVLPGTSKDNFNADISVNAHSVEPDDSQSLDKCQFDDAEQGTSSNHFDCDNYNSTVDHTDPDDCQTLLVCPVCNIEQRSANLTDFNAHVDACLSKGTITEILREQRQKGNQTHKRPSMSPITPGSSQPSKRRKTVLPQKPIPCRSIISFFKDK